MKKFELQGSDDPDRTLKSSLHNWLLNAVNAGLDLNLEPFFGYTTTPLRYTR